MRFLIHHRRKNSFRSFASSFNFPFRFRRRKWGACSESQPLRIIHRLPPRYILVQLETISGRKSSVGFDLYFEWWRPEIVRRPSFWHLGKSGIATRNDSRVVFMRPRSLCFKAVMEMRPGNGRSWFVDRMSGRRKRFVLAFSRLVRTGENVRVLKLIAVIMRGFVLEKWGQSAGRTD